MSSSISCSSINSHGKGHSLSSSMKNFPQCLQHASVNVVPVFTSHFLFLSISAYTFSRLVPEMCSVARILGWVGSKIRRSIFVSTRSRPSSACASLALPFHCVIKRSRSSSRCDRSCWASVAPESIPYAISRISIT